MKFSRRLLILVLWAILIMFAGCAGILSGSSSPTATPTDASTPTEVETVVAADGDGDGLPSDVEEAYGLDDSVANDEDLVTVLQELGGSDEAAAETLVTAATDENAMLTPAGKQFVDNLTELNNESYGAVVSALAGDGTIDKADARQAAFLTDLRADQFRQLRNEGQLDEMDVDGDEIANHYETRYGTEALQANPDIARIHQQLLQDGEITHNEERYVNRLAHDRFDLEEPYSRWGQLEELGLLHSIPADGTVTDAELEKVQNDDADMLLNAMEDDTGTNLEQEDSDNDGFWDGKEKYSEHLDGEFPNLHPAEPDFLVEVDMMEGVERLDPQRQEELVQLFKDRGTHLYITYSDRVPDTKNLTWDLSRGNRSDFEDFYEEFFDRTGDGYHYALFVENVTLYDNPYGGLGGSGTFTVSSTYSVDKTSTFMHELGHSAGISPRDFPWVDSYDVPFEEARSVMNYNQINHTTGYLGYTDEEWEYLKNQPYTPSTRNVKINRSSASMD